MSKNNNYNFWMSIILVLLTLAVGTGFHDPVLHSVVAYAFGWQIGEVHSGLLTGSTEALITASSMSDISTLSLFIFYMFPATFIFTLVYLLTIRSTSRFFLIIGTLLIALNIASFSPSIKGSDANSALNLLILREYSPTASYFFMYGIFIMALIFYSIYIYIAIENDKKDARRRLNYVLSGR